jgi:hypothetical protein
MFRFMRILGALALLALMVAPGVAGCGAYEPGDEIGPPITDEVVVDDGRGEDEMTPEAFAELWASGDLMADCHPSAQGCQNSGTPPPTLPPPTLGNPPEHCNVNPQEGTYCTKQVGDYAGQLLPYACNPMCCSGGGGLVPSTECSAAISGLKSMYATCETAADNSGEADAINKTCEGTIRCAQCVTHCYNFPSASLSPGVMTRSKCIGECTNPPYGRSCSAIRTGD